MNPAAPGLGMGTKPAVLLAGVFLLAGIVTLCGLGLGATLAGFWQMWEPQAAGPGMGQLWLLFLALPVVGVSAGIFLLGPGAMLTLAWLRPSDFLHWLLASFAVSVPLLTVTSGLASAAIRAAGVANRPVEGAGFVGLVALLGLLCLIALLRADRAGRVNWGLFAGRRLDFLVMLGLPLVVLVLLAPKFAIEGLNGDGAHALLAARLLVETNLPFWPPGSGAVGSYPSITSMLEVFPNSWFVRLFGPFELSARLLFVMALGLLSGVLLALIRPDPGKQGGSVTRPIPAFGIAAALLLYAFILAYNTSYDPYFADVAMPMAREPLIVIVFLGFALFVERQQYGLAAGFAVMMHIAVPSGLLLMGFWLVAHFLVARPLPWGQTLRGLGLVALALVVATAVSRSMEATGLAQMSNEFGANSLLRRVRFLTFDNPERLLWWALPAGLFPALSLLAWRWHSPRGRTMALVCLAYAGFFSLQAYRILPHHFAPLMILPLITFWTLRPLQGDGSSAATRRQIATGPERVAAGLTAAGLLIGAVLCWPPSLRPAVISQQFASRIEVEGPRQFDIATLAHFQSLFDAAFPMDYAQGASDRLYLASPLSWYAYATRPKPADMITDYLMRPAGPDLPWPGAALLASADGWQLYARTAETAFADRNQTGIPISIAPLYRPDRGTLFGPGGIVETRRIIDLARLAGLRK